MAPMPTGWQRVGRAAIVMRRRRRCGVRARGVGGVVTADRSVVLVWWCGRAGTGSCARPVSCCPCRRLASVLPDGHRGSGAASERSVPAHSPAVESTNEVAGPAAGWRSAADRSVSVDRSTPGLRSRLDELDLAGRHITMGGHSQRLGEFVHRGLGGVGRHDRFGNTRGDEPGGDEPGADGLGVGLGTSVWTNGSAAAASWGGRLIPVPSSCACATHRWDFASGLGASAEHGVAEGSHDGTGHRHRGRWVRRWWVAAGSR